jgi:hypothetical protein
MQKNLELQTRQLVDEIRALELFEDIRRHLGECLRLPTPTGAEVTARFLADDRFAKTLIATRNIPMVRDRMLLDPANATFTVPIGNGPDTNMTPRAIAARALDAANAYVTWGAEGFRPVADPILEKRRAACLSCDQLRAPSRSMDMLLSVTGSDTDRRICAACGCPFRKKTIMPSERCPMPSRDDPNLSRWGDPIYKDE